MPFYPEWDLQGEAVTDTNTPNLADGDVPFSFDDESDGMRVEEDEAGSEDLQDSHKQQRHGQEAAEKAEEDMDIDLLEYPQRRPSPEKRTKPAPQPRMPFPGAAGIAKASQVQVVLYSSSRKDAFAATPDGLTDDYDDGTKLVTSDLLPRLAVINTTLQQVPPRQSPAQQPPRPQPASTPKTPSATPGQNKRGRPFGWKKGHGSYSALRPRPPRGTVLAPRPKLPKPKTLSGEPKPRARLGRKPAPTARQLYLKLNPHFLAFHCEWRGCPAELQNLETLRKHLLVVHGGGRHRPPTPARPVRCEWSTCLSSSPSPETTPSFPTLAAFTSHLETSHLLPHLWHIGDGPRNTHPPFPLPSSPPTYLLNSHGEQVTPSVRGQLQIERKEERKKRAARLARVLMLRDRHAPEEPAYTAWEVRVIGEVADGKRKRLRMLREYAEGLGRGV
ncbi:hypothetical protein C8A05DRAFT_19010 [Staphylotrichum tortipilum]|uniref:C2H2-type domain-containing protein n=1 Tax=Staphylotrichum tortipilum TaxID=2831512 RepID=A0AAN6RP95_9PEZI|nr:hypothetical protein C8A05DRAFT_19010 [Staphylotrichum longicolle]